MDSDDEVHPQYFETLVYWAIQKEADLMACRFLNAKKLPMFSHQNFDIAKMNVTQYSFLQAQNDAHLKTHVWGMIYSKKILRKITFIPNLKFGEDRIFQFEVQTQNSGMNIYCADAPLYYYYQKPRDAWEGYPPLETLKLAKWYLKYDFSGNKEAESIACREAIKMLLSCRYSLMFYPEYIPKKRECNGIIKDVIRISSRKSIFDRKQMFIYSVMAYIPISYRLFRIVQDPTMISYEKNMRKWNKRRL